MEGQFLKAFDGVSGTGWLETTASIWTKKSIFHGRQDDLIESNQLDCHPSDNLVYTPKHLARKSYRQSQDSRLRIRVLEYWIQPPLQHLAAP